MSQKQCIKSIKNPKIKRFYQVYKYPKDNRVFVGVGPEKHIIENVSDEMVSFLRHLDGTTSSEELAHIFPKAKEWLEELQEARLLESIEGKDILNPDVAQRWDRQIAHFQLYDRDGFNGYEAQKKLQDARVVVLGTGAGGTTLLRFFNAVGVGQLEAVDFDTFAVENLPTHMTLDEEDIGKTKLKALEDHVSKQNSYTKLVTHSTKLTGVDDIVKILEGDPDKNVKKADFFLQAFDRPRIDAARWTNAASLQTGVPLVSIGVTDFGARCGPIVLPGKTACFECLGLDDIDFLRPSESAALMGTMVCMLASIMVHEIVKYLTGTTQSALIGKSLYINTKTMEFNYQLHKQKKGCICQI